MLTLLFRLRFLESVVRGSYGCILFAEVIVGKLLEERLLLEDLKTSLS